MAEKNRCDCPYPPGGEVVCEIGQMALCIVENNHVTRECRNMTGERNFRLYNDSRSLVNEALSYITGIERRSTEDIGYAEIQMLLSGVYIDRYRRKVSFSLPDVLLEAINDNRGLRSY